MRDEEGVPVMLEDGVPVAELEGVFVLLLEGVPVGGGSRNKARGVGLGVIYSAECY